MSYLLGSAICLLIAVIGIVVFLLFTLSAFKSEGKARTRVLIGSLIGLTVGLGYMIWGIRSLIIPVDAPVAVILPWFQATWSLNGLAAFFFVYFTVLQTHPEFFSKRAWTAIFPVIGTGTFLTMIFTYIPAIATAVEAGFVTDIMVDTFAQIVAFILVLLYLGIVPTVAIYTYANSEKTRGTKNARKAYIVLLGVLMWFVAWLIEGYRGLPEMNYTMLFARAVLVVAFIVMILGYRMKSS